jgi:HK97 family phage portal protein
VNVLTRAWTAIATQVKAAGQRITLRWGTASSWTWSGSAWPTQGAYTMARASPTPEGNSICQAVVAVIARTFPESPVQVLGPVAGGKTAPVANHPLAGLVAQPNKWYAGEQLWRATIADWYFAGNAYWYKKRNADGRPIELWWLPAWCVEPYSDDPEIFLQGYRYRAGGSEQVIPPADVVHFRNGLDAANPRCGVSPFASVLAEVFQDQEAARFGQALLANMGVPGVVLMPPGLPAGPAGEAAAEAIKSKFRERFGGDRRGDVFVTSSPEWKVQVLAFSPDQMDLTALRRVPEERISAVVGVSAMVVGLGVGLEHSIYSNYDVAYQALYETLLIPLQRLFAGELQVQLLPEVGNETREKVSFDNTNVRVLQPDLDALWKRVGQGVADAIITPNEAREAVGLKPLPGADVLYVKMTVTPTDPAELIPPEPAAQTPPLAPPAPLRALPPPKGAGGATVSRAPRAKAPSSAAYATSLTRLRTRRQPRLERQLAAYLDRQAERAAASVQPAKAAGDLDWAAETAALNAILQREYAAVLGAVHPLTEEYLGTSFELDEPTTRAYLAEAGERVVGITETTRTALAEALQAGQADGESVDQLAGRVRTLTAFNRPRAALIARTELGHASNRAALHSFTASGVVVGVRILDGDGCGLRSHDDPERADGVVVPLAEMGDIPTLAHPNCVRAFSPIVDAAELAGAA